MKKWVAGGLVFLLLVLAVPAFGAAVTIYAPDGRTAIVPEEEVSAYLAAGWYATFEETIKTIYAPDGRFASVFLADVQGYMDAGWYGSYEETIQTIYAPDGRTATVFLAEVPEYLAAGWYGSYEETIKMLYAPDGRQISVYLTEVNSYLAVGWFENRDDTIQTLYAPGDRTVTVYKSQVPSFVAAGWSETPALGPAVALTFDDGPSGIHTYSILDTLSAYGAKATFFTLGSQVNAYPGVVRRAKELGCEIGSHTYSHPNLNTCSTSKIQTEIQSAAQAIRNATGAGPTVFRPPYGNHNATVRSSVGVPLILWNVDTLDWKSRNAQSVAAHVLSHASDGDIILMHDIYGSTAEAVKIIVPALVQRGFRLVTVSELATEKGYVMTAGKVYYGF